MIQSWIEEYGPVISLKQGNDVLVIIGRHNVSACVLHTDSHSLTSVGTYYVVVLLPLGGDTVDGKTGRVLCRPTAFGSGERDPRSGHEVHATEHMRPTTTLPEVSHHLTFLYLLLLISNLIPHRVAQCHLQPKATLGYDVDQTAFVRNIVIDLLDNPESHQLHVKR